MKGMVMHMKIGKKLRGAAAALIGGVLTALSLTGCGISGKSAQENETVGEGLILEVTENGVYAASEGIGSVTFVGFKNVDWQDADGNAVDWSALSPGQQIRYNCTAMLETWPMQLSGCDSVVVTGERQDVSALVDEWNRAQAELNAEIPDTDAAENYGMPGLQLLQSDTRISSCYSPLKGTSTWMSADGGVVQDSPVPLHWTDEHLILVELGSAVKLQLHFIGADSSPDRVSVTRWDESARGTSSVDEGESVEIADDGSFAARAASVYEVSASWDGETTGGTVTWGFRTA